MEISHDHGIPRLQAFEAISWGIGRTPRFRGLAATGSCGLRDNDFARPKEVSIERESARTKQHDNYGHNDQVDGDDNTAARTGTGCHKPEDAAAEIGEGRQGPRNRSEY